MKKYEEFLILLFGYIEVIIGLVALISLAETKVFLGITKPLSVSLFVSLTAMVSFMLGVEILRYKMWARKFLMFFAGYIVLTKIFIFFGVIRLSAPFENLISSSVKNFISIIYHLSIIAFFGNEKIRNNFK